MLLDTKTLYENYNKDIFTYIFLMTGNRETSEDLMQDTFVRCYQHLHTFRQDANIQTWLRKIARNLVYDYYKRHRIMRFLPFLEKYEKQEKTYVPHDWIEVTEDMYELYAGLQELKVHFREALILRKIEGLSIKDTAVILGCTESKVENDTARALEELERVMRRGDLEDGQ